MKNKQFLLAALVATVVLFVLNALIYELYLGDFFRTHSPLTTEVFNAVTRPDADTNWLSMIISTFALGLFVATVVKWSGARTFVAGLKSGFVFGSLFLLTVDCGLFAFQNYYSLHGLLLDIVSSTVAITIGFAATAWMMGRGRQEAA
jgi:hypothetical protein